MVKRWVRVGFSVALIALACVVFSVGMPAQKPKPKSREDQYRELLDKRGARQSAYADLVATYRSALAWDDRVVNDLCRRHKKDCDEIVFQK